MKELLLVLLWNAVYTVFSQSISPFTSNVTVTVGNDAVLVCQTSNIDYASDTISWNRGESLIAFREELIDTGDGRYTLDLDTPDRYTIRITGATMEDQSKWSCKVHGASSAGDELWFTVIPMVSVSTTQFNTAENGSSSTQLYCDYTLNPQDLLNSDISPKPVVSIDWKRDSSLLVRKTVSTSVSYLSPFLDKYTFVDDASLSIANVTFEDEGVYTCLVAVSIPEWSTVTDSATTRLDVNVVTTAGVVTERIVTNAQGERVTQAKPTTRPRSGVVVDDGSAAIKISAIWGLVACLSQIAYVLSTVY